MYAKVHLPYYLNVEHENIDEFLSIRNEGHPIQNMSFGSYSE